MLVRILVLVPTPGQSACFEQAEQLRAFQVLVFRCSPLVSVQWLLRTRLKHLPGFPVEVPAVRTGLNRGLEALRGSSTPTHGPDRMGSVQGAATPLVLQPGSRWVIIQTQQQGSGPNSTALGPQVVVMLPFLNRQPASERLPGRKSVRGRASLSQSQGSRL